MHGRRINGAKQWEPKSHIMATFLYFIQKSIFSKNGTLSGIMYYLKVVFLRSLLLAMSSSQMLFIARYGQRERERRGINPRKALSQKEEGGSYSDSYFHRQCPD